MSDERPSCPRWAGPRSALRVVPAAVGTGFLVLAAAAWSIGPAAAASPAAPARPSARLAADPATTTTTVATTTTTVPPTTTTLPPTTTTSSTVPPTTTTRPPRTTTTRASTTTTTTAKPASSSQTPWGLIALIIVLVLAIVVVLLLMRGRRRKAREAEWRRMVVPALSDAQLARESLLSANAVSDDAEVRGAVSVQVERAGAALDGAARRPPDPAAGSLASSAAGSLRGLAFAVEADRLLRHGTAAPTGAQLAQADEARRARAAELNTALARLSARIGSGAGSSSG
jgi:hypothetical protein